MKEIDMLDSFAIDIMADTDIVIDEKYCFNNECDKSMPMDGYGCFVIDKAENKAKAYEILKDHVGENMFTNFCPDNFIQSDDEPYFEFYYGKFQIPNLNEFYTKLARNNISVKYAQFFEQGTN